MFPLFHGFLPDLPPAPPAPQRTPTGLVAEAVAHGVQDDATHAAQRLGGQELDLGVRVVRLHQAGGVDLARSSGEAACRGDRYIYIYIYIWGYI